MIVTHPFTSKALPTGERLFRRKHGYKVLQIAGTSIHQIVVPYARAKINEIEFIGCPVECTVNLKVLDTDTGLISTVPNYMLNQFGFDVNIEKDAYKDISQYDADVIGGMKILLEVTSLQEFTLKINIVFHEVKF